MAATASTPALGVISQTAKAGCLPHARGARSFGRASTRRGETTERARSARDASGGIIFSDAGDLVEREDIGTSELTTFDYDAVGNLRSVTLPGGDSLEYSVDGAGRRVGKTVNGVFERGWIWRSPLQPVAELDASGAVAKRFVYAGGGNVPQLMVTSAATYRLVTDHLGSVRLVVDVATGAVAQELAYDSYGRVLEDTNPGFQPFGYAGGLYDAATGLVRFGARDYDAEIGRWTAKDPSGFAGGLNLYEYAAGDPVNYLDYAGEGVFIPIIIGAVIIVSFGLSIEGDSKGAKQDLVVACSSLMLLPSLGGSAAFLAPRRPSFIPRGPGGKRLQLPQRPNGEPLPSSMDPHTQIGWREGRRGSYPQPREFGPNGQPIKQVDWTTHGRPRHTDPHVHDYLPNPTGGSPQPGPARLPRRDEL